MRMRIALSLFAALSVVPSVAAENWPAWRGPHGDGRTSETNLPLTWSPTENVRWKVPLPDEGNSTPIIWADRVFLTQATEEGKKRAVMCFSRADGKLLWSRETPYQGKETTHHTNPYCSASPVTDGERVLASLGSAGIVCYDFAGKEHWRRDTGKMEHIWGNASSPILYGDLAILWCGPGTRQFLLALDKKTGKDVWRHEEPGGKSDANRPYVGSWATPIVVRVNDHDELLLGVPEKMKGFDPKTGRELWSCDGLHTSAGDQLVYTSPVYADGIAVMMGGFGGADLAVRTGGQGDVTATHRLWYHPRNPQRIGSPVTVGGHVYILNEPGQVQCIDLKTGKDAWKKDRASSESWGSVVASGDRLYVTNLNGDTLVFAANPTKFEPLAKNSIGERVLASIAVSDGELFIRSYKHLWCFAEKK